MEIRFKNKYIRDKSTAKNIYGYWFFKRPIIIVVYVLIFLNALSCTLGFVFDPEGASELVAPFAFLVFSCALIITSYFSQIKTMVKRDEEMAGGRELICETRVTDSEITTESLGNESTLGLEGIRYAFVTSEYIILVTKAKRMFIFKKDGFTVGDSESFIAFLRENSIKVKGQKK